MLSKERLEEIFLRVDAEIEALGQPAPPAGSPPITDIYRGLEKGSIEPHEDFARDYSLIQSAAVTYWRKNGLPLHWLMRSIREGDSFPLRSAMNRYLETGPARDRALHALASRSHVLVEELSAGMRAHFHRAAMQQAGAFAPNRPEPLTIVIRKWNDMDRIEVLLRLDDDGVLRCYASTDLAEFADLTLRLMITSGGKEVSAMELRFSPSGPFLVGKGDVGRYEDLVAIAPSSEWDPVELNLV